MTLKSGPEDVWPLHSVIAVTHRRQTRMAAQSTPHATWVEVPHVDVVNVQTPPAQMPGSYESNLVQCPSETTSTEPSTTLMAVCSSMA